MEIPLVIDEKDSKRVLLGKILGIISSRRVKQEMAKQGIAPVEMAGVMLKIAFIALFFSLEISYVVAELEQGRSSGALPPRPDSEHLAGLPISEQIRRKPVYWARLRRLELHLCETRAQRGLSRRFNRSHGGCELVQEKDKEERSGGKGVCMGLFSLERSLYRV